LVLARPADTWAHRGIDFVPPDDDEIEAVLAHVSVERRNLSDLPRSPHDG
jgi:hypothetical protein